MAMPAALARYHATRSASTTVPARRSITSNPKYQALEKRVKSLGKRVREGAGSARDPMMFLGGAALPAVYTRFSGKSLPTVGGVDPELLYGGGAMLASLFVKGKASHMLRTIGAGIAAPAVNRSIKSGSVKVAGDEETGSDDTPNI